jgi:uncharacterized membrane protein YqhA
MSRTVVLESGPVLRRALASSRYVVTIAVVSTLVSSMVLLVYGVLLEASVVIKALRDPEISSKAVKALALGLIEATDVFLIGIVLFVVGLGLYRLFVDDTVPLPGWLAVSSLDELKGELVSVVIAILAVLFLGEVVKGDGPPDILRLGVAIAVVVAALSLFLNAKRARKD